MKRMILPGALALGLHACGGTEMSTTETGFARQAATGQQHYEDACASCHGAGGEGASGPRLVGLDKGALPLEPRAGSARTTRFVTAADVAAFVVAAMPPQAPGSLSADEYWAILAFDLQANGVDLGDQILGPENATTLVIPRGTPQ